MNQKTILQYYDLGKVWAFIKYDWPKNDNIWRKRWIGERNKRVIYLYNIKSNKWTSLSSNFENLNDVSSPRSLGKLLSNGNKSNQGSPKSSESGTPVDKQKFFRNTAIFEETEKEQNAKKFSIILNKTIRTKYNSRMALQSINASTRALKQKIKARNKSMVFRAKPPVTPTNLKMKNSFIFNSACRRSKKSSSSINKSDSKFQSCKIVGGIPGPRDGHTSILFENKLIVFGGDRHQMALNDLFEYKIDLA